MMVKQLVLIIIIIVFFFFLFFGLGKIGLLGCTLVHVYHYFKSNKGFHFDLVGCGYSFLSCVMENTCFYYYSFMLCSVTVDKRLWYMNMHMKQVALPF